MNLTLYPYSHKVSGDPKDTADEGHVITLTDKLCEISI